jgi:hypothetical protein
MKICENGVIREMTSEELSQIQKEQRKAELSEQSRPLTTEEVTAMLITTQINTLSVDDNTALRMKSFYPEWEAGKAYTTNFKLTYNNKLYKVIQAHTSQVGWEPENVPAMFTEICETHEGILEDPIPYNSNMILEEGKYYIQDNEIYICTRNSIYSMYHKLAELVGQYVELAI